MHTLADLRAGKLAGIKRLDLSCGLSEFPVEIFDLADTLEVLNLSGNSLTSLPDDLCRLTRLRVLFASDNAFTHLPESIGQCQQLQIVGLKANRIEQVSAAALPPRLRWLILTDNCIEYLPDELGRRPDLQKLMLAGNRLRTLPATLADCHKLELIRIAANRLTELPDWLLSLPALAWLAYADNPLCAEHRAEPIRQIPWHQLSIGQRLGEGASGIIQQALWQHANNERMTAVKLYKGSVTSDGSPLNEMAACIAAGRHANLIEVLGQISGHPDQQRGLVMELIAPDFGNLAGPPSLESCTRDVYARETRFSLPVLLRIAEGIASVTAHLHANGITHGDLYGHNILVQEDGNCLLSDFGAASFHPSAVQGKALERIETRAFGILLGELLERCDADEQNQNVIEGLRALQASCVQTDCQRRPSLAEILLQIKAWGA
ncbi:MULTISPECIES: leucine-rich repeat-containing protein kinase family protein [Pseudomonas]|uniref:Protein kinase n=5 Tax=Pseudomonas syringae group TaxID=136849 RepID=A0A0P9W5L5_PSESS|nr:MULTISPECIES: leucine-rich repeat-containing protein kinase family protein [Pseudomonas]ARD12176.1 protein kinase [Pseudomonas savastanoi pv. savastanoi NCPPB 3335]KAA3548892.1 protein kinase [Pseudomonas savastanoi]KPB19871.1 Serine/threonine protein kinase [Pseudomonas savastanoi]KPW74170.1 Serine/threonine protein kinase [Pseudomonas amygdali pv. ciccaronei]KPX04055.1 Serine/threonine protein kinase [Pseudomonas syringae pv. daphniphylli]